tara:strand:+ start:919 stop:1173 length:255 start_codon:yes stop_codon:yes gene_type:complete
MSHSYENRESIIFNVSELSKIDYAQVYETEDVRRSVDQTKGIVKWEHGSSPDFLDALTTKEGPYTYEETMQIMLTEEWRDPFIV